MSKKTSFIKFLFDKLKKNFLIFLWDPENKENKNGRKRIVV